MGNYSNLTERKNHRMSYRLAIFDLDGTILDTLEDLKESTNAALAANGYPERTLEEVRCFVGNGIGKLIERAVPKGTSKEATKRRLRALRFTMVYIAQTTQSLMMEL